MYLTCQEKIEYCQYALDTLQEATDRQHNDTQLLAKYKGLLIENIKHYRFQVEVIMAISNRMTYLRNAKVED